jgi:hypothetical protein
MMFPFFVYGLLNNILPWYLIHKLAGRIKDRQFINSARMASGLLAFPVFYIIQTLIFWFFSGSLLWTAAYLFSLPVSGVLSLNLAESWKEWKQQLKLKSLSPGPAKKLEEVKNTLFRKLGIEI